MTGKVRTFLSPSNKLSVTVWRKSRRTVSSRPATWCSPSALCRTRPPANKSRYSAAAKAGCGAGLAHRGGVAGGRLAVYLGAVLRPVPSPEFRRVTFERGTVYSARFTPDGGSVVYGASWNGRPLQIYSTIPDSLMARPLGLSSAYLLSVSRSKELALILHGRPGSRLEFEGGTLARSPFIGGTPREILQDVAWADWSPAGELAVVHDLDGRDRLEYPVGKVLYQSSGAISNIRFSPQGDRIAFLDHPDRWDESGSVRVTDLAGEQNHAFGWLGIGKAD